MGVIKSNLAPRSASPFSMKDIEQAARNMLLRARQQADQLLAAAQAEGEKIKQQMREEGLADGRAAGYQQGLIEGQQEALEQTKKSMAELHAVLVEALGQFEQSREQLSCTATTEVVALAAAIAKRVTKRQAMLDPAVLEENIAEAMKLVVHSADLRVAIAPSQMQTMTELLPKLTLDFPAMAHATIIEDPTLSPGGCRLLTAHGEIDADIEGQLDRIIGELLPVEDGK